LIEIGKMGADTVKNIVVLGSEGVGKSSLCIKYTTDLFPENHLPTQVVDTYQKWFTLDKKTHTKNIFGSSVKQIKLNITDTAGQEEMVSLLDKHLEGKDVVLLVLSLSDRKSLERAVNTYDRSVRSVRRSDENRIPPIVIICNKSDLQKTDPNSIQFTKEDIKSVLKNVHDKQIVYTSAKEGTNVNEAFIRAVQLMGSQKDAQKCRVM